MDLERELERLRAETDDPRAGLFGPGSKLWEVGRHSVIFLGAGRAVLLQLAHPWVAQAIADHSRTRDDPLGRFRRTFARVFSMVYGDLESALAAAREVHELHASIAGTLDEDAGAFARGSPYRACDVAALRWVHATLCDTSLLLFELLVRPLSSAEREGYLLESRRFAALFGLPADALPPDAAAFAAYNREMWDSDTLAVTRTAAEIARFLFLPRHPGLAPVMRWYRTLTAGLLPRRIRAGFGLRFEGERDRRLLAVTLAMVRASEPYWPRHLRYLPPYLSARRRLAGRDSPDPLVSWLQRLWMGSGSAGLAPPRAGR